ncbi:DUF6691 family protein [Arenicellales bacterium nBUS_45]|jgi:hypothetical protein
MGLLMIFLSGVLFALGLGISGMTQPEKIVSFLNVVGEWDPSLIFVMLGASMTYLTGYRFILKRPKPILAKSFSLPTRRDIDLPLVFGSLLFGLGWGLVGFCPGPALVALVTGYDSVLIFVLAMGFGMYAFEVIDSRFKGDPDGGAGLIIKR